MDSFPMDSMFLLFSLKVPPKGFSSNSTLQGRALLFMDSYPKNMIAFNITSQSSIWEYNTDQVFNVSFESDMYFPPMPSPDGKIIVFAGEKGRYVYFIGALNSDGTLKWFDNTTTCSALPS